MTVNKRGVGLGVAVAGGVVLLLAVMGILGMLALVMFG